MRYFVLFLLILSSTLSPQDFNHMGDESLANSAFPVRLTQEEQEEHEQRLMHPELFPATPHDGCCKTSESNGCVASCCKPPSIHCPPVRPQFDPCDCIMDYLNPLVFNGFDLNFEMLVWKVAQKSTYTIDQIEKYQSPEFDWNLGLRLGLGYTFERDAWKLMGQYTYYGTNGSDSINRSDSRQLNLHPTLAAKAIPIIGFDRIRTNTSFDYQVWDCLLSRRFLPGTQVVFEFFAGPTAAVITEKWKVISHSGNLKTNSKNYWSFSSGGMRVGLDATWSIGGGWGLYNKSSFASLIGGYENRRKTTLSEKAQDPQFPYLRNTREEETWVVPATQLEFGLNWNRQFCHWAIAVQGALEVNTWYDLHQLHQDAQIPTFPEEARLDYRNASPVSLWGFNLRVNFSF